MTLDEMIADIRREINQPATDGFLSNHEIAAFINRGQDMIAARMMEMDQNFFEDTDQTLGFVANQEEYDLPAKVQNRKITLVKQTDVDLPDGRTLDYMQFQLAKKRYGVSSPIADPAVYYLRGQKLGIKPIPKANVSTNILIYFLMLPHELHHAQVGAPGATSFTMPMATTGSSPLLKAGRISTTPNYYIGAKIRVITGTDRGLERTITAFDVATRVATIDSSWTPANVQNQDYVILSPIPPEHHNLNYQIGLMKAAKKAKDKEAYATAKDEIAATWGLLDTVIPRHQDGPRHISLPDDFED